MITRIDKDYLIYFAQNLLQRSISPNRKFVLFMLRIKKLGMELYQLNHLLDSEIDNIGKGQRPKELFDPILYLMHHDSQRLYAFLTLLSCHLFSNEVERAIKPAIGMEMFHEFVQMSEDLIHDQPGHNGVKAVHRKWGQNAVILSGDVMLIYSYKLLSELEGLDPQILADYVRCSATIIEGQQIRLQMVYPHQMGTEEYLDFIRRRMAVFSGFCLELGGAMGRAAAEDRRLLRRLGENFGMALQLKREIDSLYGAEENGHSQGEAPWNNNQLNFLLLLALDQAAAEEKAEIDSWLKDNKLKPEEKRRALQQIFDRLRIPSQVRQHTEAYYKAGVGYLRNLEVDDQRKQELMNFIDQALELN
jgi:geranylgeranyl diphosphate synthase type II